jgi:hypothetical protein
VHPHREDARERRAAPLDAQIGGRKSEGAAEAVAVHHPAGHRVGAAQAAAGLREVAACEQLAHPAAAHPLPVKGHRRHDVHLEAELGPGGGEQRHVGLAVPAKAEVVADHHQPGAQLPRQQARKLLSR